MILAVICILVFLQVWEVSLSYGSSNSALVDLLGLTKIYKSSSGFLKATLVSLTKMAEGLLNTFSYLGSLTLFISCILIHGLSRDFLEYAKNCEASNSGFESVI